MAAFHKAVFQKITICLGMCAFLVIYGSDGRPVAISGSVTQTNVRHFEFFARIANPCEVGPGSAAITPAPSTTTTTRASVAAITAIETRMDYLQSVATQVEITLRKLQTLESNDPSLPECNGISLDSLPGTPAMEQLNEADTLKQIYKTGIYLATHFHLMSLDRQTTIQGDTNVPDDQLEENTPSWRFLRCGNESESFPASLQDVIESTQNVLCTMLSSATDEQRASFRDPFNKLGTTVLYRYHSSCSTLQTRDCLVVREAKQAFSLILRKLTNMITSVSTGNGESGMNGGGSQLNDEDMMDNSL